MGDDNRGAPLHQLVQATLNFAFCLGVQRRSGLVQDEQGSIFQNCARNSDALLLATRELQPALTNSGVVAVGEAANEVVGIGLFGRSDDFLIGSVGFAVGDVLPNSTGEQRGVLEHDGGAGAQSGTGNLGDIRPQNS